MSREDVETRLQLLHLLNAAQVYLIAPTDDYRARELRAAIRAAEMHLTAPPPPDVPAQVVRGPLAYAELSVREWCESDDGSGRAVAVDLVFAIPSFGMVLSRLRSAAAVDEVCAILQRHKLEVWPESAV